MRDVDFDILMIFGLLMGILELILSWLWAHTTSTIELQGYHPFLILILYAFPIIMIAIFALLLSMRKS